MKNQTSGPNKEAGGESFSAHLSRLAGYEGITELGVTKLYNMRTTRRGGKGSRVHLEEGRSRSINKETGHSTVVFSPPHGGDGSNRERSESHVSEGGKKRGGRWRNGRIINPI